MGRIKGPITIKGFKSQDFMKGKILEAAKLGDIKLPFTATGFSSTKIPKEASLEGIEFAKGFDPKNPKLISPEAKEVKVEKPKLVDKIKEKIVGVEKEYSMDDLTDIKGIGKKTVKELKKLYKSMDKLKEALGKDDIYDKLRDDIVDILKRELGE